MRSQYSTAGQRSPQSFCSKLCSVNFKLIRLERVDGLVDYRIKPVVIRIH